MSPSGRGDSYDLALKIWGGRAGKGRAIKTFMGELIQQKFYLKMSGRLIMTLYDYLSVHYMGWRRGGQIYGHVFTPIVI